MAEPTETSDEALLQAWTEGDETAGQRLFERHFELVYRFVAAQAPGSTEVADLVQRTFLACLERPEQIAGAQQFRPYLLGIARNQVRLQRRHLRVRAGEELVEDPQIHAPATFGPRLSEVAGRRQEHRLLLLALRELPLRLQLPLELHYWDGMSTGEIGALLDLTQGAVKKRLFTARRQLAKAIGMLAPDAQTAELSLRQFEQWAQSLRDLFGPDESAR